MVSDFLSLKSDSGLRYNRYREYLKTRTDVEKTNARSPLAFIRNLHFKKQNF